MTVTYMFRTKNREAQPGDATPVFEPPPALARSHSASGPRGSSGSAPFLLDQGTTGLPTAASDDGESPAKVADPVTRPSGGSLARYVSSAGRIILVSKARGGIGATTLAVNLALEMQVQAAKRHGAVGGRVALVDLDVQLGNAGSLLDLADRGGMLALARLGSEPDGQAVRHAIVRHASGLSVLAAPSTPIPFEAFDIRRIASILDALAETHDVVIVDLPPALIDWLEPVLARAERLLMVTDLAVPSITRARRIITLMTEDHPDLPVEIVVAHERKPFRLGQSHRDAASALGHALHHWLPDETKLARQALDRGEPLVQLAPRCGYCKAVRTIAANLAAPGRPTQADMPSRER